MSTTHAPALTCHVSVGPWVKLCGVRSAQEAEGAVVAGADGVGLNFFRQSRRFVNPEEARPLVDLIRGRATAVGLFVNEPIDAVCDTVETLGLEAVQFHGDESAAEIGLFAKRFPDVAVVRAVRIDDTTGIGPIEQAVSEAASAGFTPSALLVDARVSGQFGGTGRRAPWDLLAEAYDREAWPPLVLAGGLTPENVAEAVKRVRPWGVDVAGGVEDEAGAKSAARMARFVAAARATAAAPG